MSYLNKIILEFTKEKIVAYQYDNMILVSRGGRFNTLSDFINVYKKREDNRRRVFSRNINIVMYCTGASRPEALKAFIEHKEIPLAIKSLSTKSLATKSLATKSLATKSLNKAFLAL
jgi:hypothetical protein